MRDRRADARQTLQQEQPSGGEALRLPVESAQNLLLSACLIGQKAKDAERMFRIGRMEHRQPPHRRKRHKSPFREAMPFLGDLERLDFIVGRHNMEGNLTVREAPYIRLKSRQTERDPTGSHTTDQHTI
jgi:hypothetical protein